MSGALIPQERFETPPILVFPLRSTQSARIASDMAIMSLGMATSPDLTVRMHDGSFTGRWITSSASPDWLFLALGAESERQAHLTLRCSWHTCTSTVT